MVTIRIPVPSSTTLLNWVGLAGLIAIVAAVGLLTDWRWSLLAAGVIAVGITMLAQNAAQAEPSNVRPLAAQRRKAAG